MICRKLKPGLNDSSSGDRGYAEGVGGRQIVGGVGVAGDGGGEGGQQVQGVAGGGGGDLGGEVEEGTRLALEVHGEGLGEEREVGVVEEGRVVRALGSGAADDARPGPGLDRLTVLRSAEEGAT